ncbi:hypothetical protein BGX28_007659 [Mortierella sp. GBA30]|nr:hypothetical protein BGX28_007659 [Mortierella sp. GBA30]
MHIPPVKSKASLVLFASLTTVYANIAFVKIPSPTIVKPGDSLNLQWTIVTPVVGTPETAEPFNLVLRAYSGQTYDVQKLVPQTLTKLTVVIPKGATGGLHSFLADYTGPVNVKGAQSNQFNVTGEVVPTTTAAIITSTAGPTTTVSGGSRSNSNTATPSHGTQASNEGDGGLSGGALAGIISGAVVFFLLIALIFFFRHRRLVRERSQHTRLEDSKESYGETSTARSGPPSVGAPSLAGKGGDGMVSVPLSVAPAYPAPFGNEPKYQDEYGGPQQHQMQHTNGNNNPFEAPEDRMRGPPPGAMAMAGSPRSLSPRQQHQPYQPPQFEQQPPRLHQQPYGMPQQRNQSPFQQSNGRDSMDSEPESAYDPAHTRMMNNNGNGPVMRNNSSPMMQPGSLTGSGSQLSYSASGRSVIDRQNMSPQPQAQQQNPFQDRELMTAAAGGAAIGAIAAANRQQGSPNSPAQTHRQLAQSTNDTRTQSPLMGHALSPRSREIEMQPLDVQQHQYEQQQRVLQRQQQQRQLAQEQKQQKAAHVQQPIQETPLPPTPAVTSNTPAPVASSHPFDPTLYDDKAEIDDDGMPVYNGYRDTIFGAYSQPQGDDEDEDEETPVPIVPSATMAQAGNNVLQQQQQQSSDTTGVSNGNEPGVQRKKSVKFTGIPLSGPINVPPATTAQESSLSKPQQKQQQQLYHSDGDEEEDDDEYEDEDDIKMRLMETEVPSPSSVHVRPPFINTTPGSSPLTHQNALSPVQLSDQAYSSEGSYHASHGHHAASNAGGFPVPAPMSSQPTKPSNGIDSPSLNAVSSSFGDGFYEDVLAAVDQNVTSPSKNVSSTAAAGQQKQSQPTLVDREVYGAPSPRITSAAISTHQQQQQYSKGGQSVRPQQQQHHHQQQRSESDAGFYESPLV